MPEIFFHKPDLNSLAKQGCKCVDMHFQTLHSTGSSTVDEILKKARKLNIGVAITDHDDISGVLEAYEKKTDEDFIIPGIEVRSEENIDLLYYFYDIKSIKKFYSELIKHNKTVFGNRPIAVKTKINVPLKKLITQSGKYNCIFSVAHPFGYHKRRRADILEEFKDILPKQNIFEAVNGVNSLVSNKKSAEFIRVNNKGFTGGSDGHSIFELGEVVTYSKARDVKEFLDNIKAKKNSVAGTSNSTGRFGPYLLFGINYLKTMMLR